MAPTGARRLASLGNTTQHTEATAFPIHEPLRSLLALILLIEQKIVLSVGPYALIREICDHRLKSWSLAFSPANTIVLTDGVCLGSTSRATDGVSDARLAFILSMLPSR